MKCIHARKWKVSSRHATWPEADRARKGLIKKEKFIQGDTVKVNRFEKSFVVKTAGETRAEAIARAAKSKKKE
jgi:hypothetical protein